MLKIKGLFVFGCFCVRVHLRAFCTGQLADVMPFCLLVISCSSGSETVPVAG